MAKVTRRGTLYGLDPGTSLGELRDQINTAIESFGSDATLEYEWDREGLADLHISYEDDETPKEEARRLKQEAAEKARKEKAAKKQNLQEQKEFERLKKKFGT